MNDPVTELAIFKTIPTVSEQSFREAVLASDRFLRSGHGFVSRRLSHSRETGEWIDVVLGCDLATAQAAAQNFMAAPDAQAFRRCIDPASVQMRHGSPFHSA